MGTVQHIKQQQGKRKASLSPELTEVLHMLKSLEGELAAKDNTGR